MLQKTRPVAWKIHNRKTHAPEEKWSCDSAEGSK